MSGRVIVVGSVNIDLVARVPHLPHPGETVTGGSYDRHHGGKGGNQAVAAARLRRPTLFIGAVGDDTFENEARRALITERVDVSMVASLPGQATGVALILVDANGENQIAVIPGANGAIEAGYARDCLARLGPLTGDVVLLCNEVPLHVVREALTCARAAGATTVLNPAPATGIDRSIFALADIITPNRNELGMLLHTEALRTGRRTDASQEIPSRARLLLEPGPEGPGVRKAVIVTLGSSGVLVIERRESGPSKAFPEAGEPANVAAAGREADGLKIWELPAERVSTLDSTGAGDAFNGALAAAIAEGRPFAQAVQRAVAAGALATTHVGAREGMPTAAELEEFLAR
jgi:ribokinase